MSEKSIVQKMLVKPGQGVALLNALPDFETQLTGLPAGASLTRIDHPANLSAAGQSGVILLFSHDRAELEAWLPPLKVHLTPQVTLWVAYPKGTGAKSGVNRDLINAFAAGLGLQGVAMFAIDATWSALRLKLA